MEKLIPILLVLVLLGGGVVAWQYFAPDDVGEPATTTAEQPRDVDVPKVEKRADETGYRAEAAPTGDRQPSVTPVAEVGPEDVLQGTIVDASDRPLAGVAIKLFQFRFKEMAPEGRTRIEHDEVELGRTHTDDRGHYEFRDELAGVQGNSLSMRATKEGFASVMKDHVGPGSIVDFKLAPGAVITGRLIDMRSGKPLPEARVEGSIKRESTSMSEYARWHDVVSTDAEGRFRFTGAPGGPAALKFEHPDYETTIIGLEQAIDVPVSGVKDIGDFKIMPGIVFEGEVRDAATGEPVDKALVAYNEMLGILPAVRVRTGVFGKFKITGVKRGEQVIQVTADGYTPFSARILMEDQMSGKPQVLRLLPAGAARGQVVDAAGRPVAGAKIYVAEAVHMFHKVRADAEALTGPSGEFLVRGLGDGTAYRFLAKAPDKVLAGSEGTTFGVSGETVEDVLIIVEEGATIQGRVTDDTGVAVANVPVILEKPPFLDAWIPPNFGVGQKDTLSVLTDENGAYRFEGLYAGNYTVLADDDRFIPTQPRRIQVDSAKDSLNQDFALQLGNSIAGVVRDAFGNPVEGAVVEAMLERGSSQKQVAVSNADGAYEVRRLSDRPYRLIARSDDAISAAISDVPSNSTGIDFILEKMGTLEGRVLGRDGSLVRRFTVKLMPLHEVERGADGRWDRGERRNLKAIMTHEGFQEVKVEDADGTFRIEKVVPGDYDVVIESDEHREARRDGVSVTPGATTRVPEFLLNEGASLEGFVRDSEGRPVAGSDVQIALLPGAESRRTTQTEEGRVETVTAPSQWAGKRITPDANGFYSAGGLPPGQIDVVLSSAQWAVPERESITLGSTGLTQKDFVVTRAGSMTFRVVDDADQPVPNPQVRVLSGGTPARVDGRPVTGRPTGHGQVNVQKVLPGNYEVTFHRPGYETQQQAVTVKPGETTSLVVRMPVLR